MSTRSFVASLVLAILFSVAVVVTACDDSDRNLTRPGCRGVECKLTASDATTGAKFGRQVAISGDFVFANALDEALGGVVYVFRFDGRRWHEVQKIVAPEMYERGIAMVAADGDVLAAGVTGYAGGSVLQRAVVAYRFDGRRWQLEDVLVGSGDIDGTNFGARVAISGNVIVAGAERDDDYRGAFYVFRYSEEGWQEEQKVVNDTARSFDQLGYDVDVEGELIVASATGEDTNAPNWGAIHVYAYDGATWVEEDVLAASYEFLGGGLGLGHRVSISGDRVVATSSSNRRAYVFGFDGLKWSQTQKIVSPDSEGDDLFGRSVWIAGDTLVLGAPFCDVPIREEGCVWTFEFDGAEFVADRRIQAWDRFPEDHFGFIMAGSDDRFVIGVPEDDREPLWAPGAVYVFEL